MHIFRPVLDNFGQISLNIFDFCAMVKKSMRIDGDGQ